MSYLPTLTTAGWMNDIINKSTKLMDYFLASEHSQSNAYHGRITSFPKLVQQYGHNPERMSEQTRDALQAYYARYFENVIVSVDADRLDDDSGQYNLSIDVALSQDDKSYSLGKLIALGNSKILDIKTKDQRISS